jgi:hypothetical protein
MYTAAIADLCKVEDIMAQVDAGIPLRAIGGQGGMTTAEAFSLADFAEERQQRREERPYRMEALRAQSQQNAMSLQQMQLNLKKAQGVLKIAQTPGMMDEDGAPTAEGVKAGMSLDPMEIGPAWAKQRREASKAKMEETYQKMDMLVKQGQLDEKSAKNVKETFTELSKVYTSKLNKAIAYHDQNPHETAVAAVQAEAERRHKAGLLNDDQYQKIIGAKWDNEMAEGIISAGEPTKTPSEYEDIIKRQKGLSPTSPEWKQLEQRRVYLTEHPAPIAIMQTPEGKTVTVEPKRGGDAIVRDVKMGDQKMSLSKGSGERIEPLDENGKRVAEELIRAGKPLPGGWSKTGQSRGNAILNDMGKNETGGAGSGDITGGMAEYKANAGALASLTKDINTFEPYKKMLDTNADIAIKLGQKIQQTAPMMVNKPLNWLRQNATTNPDVAEYLAQMRFVQTEAARVINNPRIVGQLTDESRREMDEVVNGNAPIAVVERVLNRLKSDGTNRFNAMRQQQQSIVDQLKGGKKDSTSGAIVKPYTGDSGKTPGDIQDLLDKYK